MTIPKKKAYGLTTTQRTIEEINLEYNQNAAQCGHKTRILWQLQSEIEGHVEKMTELTEESKLAKPALPTETKPEVKQDEQAPSDT